MENLRKKRMELKPAQILGLGFAAVIFVGTILLSLPIVTVNGESVGIINGLFTSTSAVCVTGLVVVDTGTYWNDLGKIIILILIQIGGLGFMTMTTLAFFVMGRKIGLRSRVIMQEALNQFNISGIVRLTRYILATTFIIEGIGAIFLATRFIPAFGLKRGIAYSIFHSISAFCNAGFDVMGNFRSLTEFAKDPVVNFVVMILIIIGGLGFGVIMDIIKNKKYNKLSLHSKLVIFTTGILLIVGFVLFLALEYNNPDTFGEMNFFQKIMGALFQSVTPRTAGFNTIPTDKLRNPSILLTMILMFIGGSPGSTAGGIKTTTFGMIFLTIFAVIKGGDDIEFSKRRVSKDTANKALAIFGIVMFLAYSFIFLLTITDGDKDFLSLSFEVFSALGTVGLSQGITPFLSNAGKIIISLAMFLGRVGPLTIVVALSNRGDKRKLMRYPEGKVSVG